MVTSSSGPNEWVTTRVNGTTGPRPVTVHDVAAAAGVSIATVSRVLTGSRPVRPDLQIRVLAAAERLNYQVNLLGRALRQGRSQSVGLVVPDLENPFFAALSQQVSRAFTQAGIDVFISSADNDLVCERRAVESFLGRQVDGIVIIPCNEVDSAATVQLADRAVCTVQFDRLATNVASHRVGCDNAHGMALISRHLHADADLNAQPAIFVGATPGSSTAHARLRAFERALPSGRTMLGSFSFDWGRQAATEAIQQGVTSATFVGAADIISLGIIAAVHAAGLDIPNDVRVTGFDDVGVAFLAHPALTTIRQPVHKMTAAILDIIVSNLHQPRPERPVIKRLRPTLVIRESSPAADESLPARGRG